uniref:Growth hormone releasing hormone receptor 2 n=1 Tax=Seriola lalandi dorsalis TaxID=1841481 RepID=A0A3B4WBT5_SERLL
MWTCLCVTGCVVEWDGVSCWPAASEDEVVSVHCPLPLTKPETPPVLISRKCTVRGWSKPNLPYYKACYSDKNYFETVKLIYSVGYGVSLAALLIAALLFCCFRKLLCARNYIHLNLFVSFMLRSLAVFIKDDVLFADESTDHCTVSTLRCQAAVTFFNFCVVSNFWWLLVEALYLQTLLLLVFTQTRKLLWIYAVIGWGAPTVTVVIWALLKTQLEDEGIIKIPILLSICINFLIFLNISRIIVQKTKPDSLLLRRCTLLLIPLFGLHYVVFALFPDHVGVGPRLYLELVLGSFQVTDPSQHHSNDRLINYPGYLVIWCFTVSVGLS